MGLGLAAGALCLGRFRLSGFGAPGTQGDVGEQRGLHFYDNIDRIGLAYTPGVREARTAS